MDKKVLTAEQKRSEQDLIIVLIITLAVLAAYMAFSSRIDSLFKNRDISLVLRTLFMALFQFGTAGLGISLVSIIRKEKFSSSGLRKENAIKAVLLSILAVVPYLVFRAATNSLTSYLPFQQVWATEEWLALGFPKSIPGIAIIAAAWGFFEGFNYAVINDKINKRWPVKNIFLRPGAIVCAVLCILIHGLVGVTPSAIAEGLTVFLIIYGMLVIKEYTHNAWGCVFIFLFFWNAI
ncbi:MAG: hypothetical protein BWY11_01886 [Firmicutes bacterium ADurb.Bin182]|nr:MAG: hypothetical protein BWY11_01886 [Firmicutes bacterium ADurb.Bin182]